MTDATLEIKRVIAAPIERVFDAWMIHDQWESWIGPEGIKCEIPQMEPRVGGQYKIMMHLATGQTMPVIGTYKIIERPTRIAFGWKMEGGEHDSLVTISLRDLGGKTELTLRHEGLLTPENRDGHGKGWNSALNKLEAFLK
jgi:uncharacterized protein YndB with AHSA1/START domain